MPKDIKNSVKQTFLDSISVKQQIVDDKSYEVLLEAGSIIANSITNGGKLLLCGNGGSAADAQHLAAEFLIRLTSEVNRESIPALSLAQDTSTLTACINDYGSDDIFKRVLSGLSKDGDILLAITTSGNSKNILEVLKKAKDMSIKSILLSSEKIIETKKPADLTILVPSESTARIQEAHIFIGQTICEIVESKILD